MGSSGASAPLRSSWSRRASAPLRSSWSRRASAPLRSSWSRRAGPSATLWVALALALGSPWIGCGAGGARRPHASGRAHRRAPSPPPAATAPAEPPPQARAPLPALPVADERHLPSPASLEAEACFALLDANDVRYHRAPEEGHDALLALDGPIAGVDVAFVGRDRAHALMDCRVAAALLLWAPDLRALGVRGLRHLSVYRRGAVVATTGRPSGHAGALAIDLRYLDFDDGHTLDVLADWGDRTHDAAPCPADRYPDDASPAIRALVCAAVARDAFQTVITPHHNQAHQNHVHLEVVPGVDWRFVH
jgi:hypothetical protein